MDHATASLNAIVESDDYERIEGVPVFDAHDEFDRDGNLVRSFSKKKLEDICKRSNRRADETGDLSPAGPGHTIPDAPETEQPPIYAYAKNYRVGEFGPAKKTGILVDFFVKKTADDGRGNDIDGMKAFKSYPRRSVELWLKDGYIDWIALLRKTPQRDLGLLAYSKGHRTSLPSRNQYFGSPARTRSLSAAVRSGKLCYSMDSLEANMDPTLPADANGPDADFEAKVDTYLKTKYPHLDKVYEKAAAEFAPPVTEPRLDDGMGDDMIPPPDDAMGGDLPPTDDAPPMGDAPPPPVDDKKLDFSKNPRSAQNRLAFLEKENKRLAAKLAEAEKTRNAEKLAYSKANAEELVDVLERDGILLDRDVEVAYFAKLPLGDKRTERADYIRRTHRTGNSRHLPPAGIYKVAGGAGSKNYSKDVVERTVAHCSETGDNYDETLAKFAAAK